MPIYDHLVMLEMLLSTRPAKGDGWETGPVEPLLGGGKGP